MKPFKYALGLAALCAASSSNAATLRITNNTGLPVRVVANGESKNITKDPKPIDWNITVPLTYVSWSEFNRHGQKMTSYTTSKAQLTGSGDLGELSLEKGGHFKWKGPKDASLSNARFAAREGQQRNDLAAKEGQEQLVDFIKAQPEKEQTCWVLALTIGVIDPVGMANAKDACVKQTPENQKRLVAAQMGIVQAKALKKQPAPLPADLEPIYREVIAASEKTMTQLPAALNPAYQKSDEHIGGWTSNPYANQTALSALLGSSEGPVGKMKSSITQLVLGIVLTIMSFGTATPATVPMIAFAVANTVISAVTTGAELAVQGILLQRQQNKRP